MVEVQTSKNKNLGKGFGISKEDNKRAVACPYVIDTNKRAVLDKVNKKEPRMTD